MRSEHARAFRDTLGQGTRRQRWSRWTWEVPQTVLGVLAVSVLLAAGRVRRVRTFHGAAVVETRARRWGGVALGSVLIVRGGAPDKLVRHEYGHYLDSRRFGPLYLLVIGLPSLLSAWASRFGWPHRRCYTERRADRNAERLRRRVGGLGRKGGAGRG